MSGNEYNGQWSGRLANQGQLTTPFERLRDQITALDERVKALESTPQEPNQHAGANQLDYNWCAVNRLRENYGRNRNHGDMLRLDKITADLDRILREWE